MKSGDKHCQSVIVLFSQASTDDETFGPSEEDDDDDDGRLESQRRIHAYSVSMYLSLDH